MLLSSRLSLLFISVLIFIVVASCSADRRVNYKAHPELKSIQSSHPGPYNKMVKLYSEHYEDDVILNEKVVEQANAINRVFELMSPEISFKYDQLTEESAKDAFSIEIEKLEQQIESLDKLPLIDWTQVEKNMISYLEIRNERVRELKASMETPDSSVVEFEEIIETK